MEIENKNSDNTKGCYVTEVPVRCTFIPVDPTDILKFSPECIEKMRLAIENCNHEFYDFGREYVVCWKCGIKPHQ